MTSVTNIPNNEDNITKEDFNAGLNDFANLISPHNAALKEWSYLIGVACKPGGILVREFYAEMKVYDQKIGL